MGLLAWFSVSEDDLFYLSENSTFKQIDQKNIHYQVEMEIEINLFFDQIISYKLEYWIKVKKKVIIGTAINCDKKISSILDNLVSPKSNKRTCNTLSLWIRIYYPWTKSMQIESNRDFAQQWWCLTLTPSMQLLFDRWINNKKAVLLS